jgi:alpha-L-rhamnosidase
MYQQQAPAGRACWQGCHFISNPHTNEQMGAPFFRKTVTLCAKPVSAVVFLCGVGYHEFYVNGSKAGDSFLTPAQSLYDRRVYYNTYDISALLTEGDNTFSVILGNGLYNCSTAMWNWAQASWKHRPKLLFFGDIALGNGERLTVASDASFETGESRITYNSYYGGETQDYTRPLFPDGPVQKALIDRSPGGVLTPFPEPHVKEHRCLTPVKTTALPSGKTLFDFGTNMTGWAHVDAQAAGRTRFTLRYGEELDSEGNLDTQRIADLPTKGGRFQTDEYILDAEHPVMDGRPHFTYHGFRYIELSVEEGELSGFDIRAYTLNSALREIGGFAASDEYMNRIYEMGQKASISNLVNVPTDCPHREKNGWTGDVALSAEQMCLNRDMTAFFRRWLQDVRDSQRPSGQLPGVVPSAACGFNWGSGPVWDSALFELPLAVYRCYGDASLLRENWDAMSRYMEFCASMEDDHIVSFGLGDWCPPKLKDEPGSYACPEAVSDTATYYTMARTMALVAELAVPRAGNRAENRMEKQYYQTLAADIKEAFNRHFVSETGVVSGDCQTAQGIALSLNLIEGALAEKAVEYLCGLIENKKGHLDFGIIGSKYVFEALSRYGRGQVALDMILREGFPSYRHWLDTGATTMAESWGRLASDNHHMFSDVCRWFVRFVAGLGAPDFYHHTIVFTPDFLPSLTFAEAFTEIPAGKLGCRWERLEQDIRFTCTVPEGFSINVSPLGREKYTVHGDYHDGVILSRRPGM